MRARRTRAHIASRTCTRIACRIDLAWAAIEAAIVEREALDQKVRTTASEAETGSDVSRRLGVNGRMLHRGAVLATASRVAMLLGN